MKLMNTQSSWLLRLVMWFTSVVEAGAERIERRNKKVAMRVICHAQAWLIKLGYAADAISLERPIREIAIGLAKDKFKT